MARLRAYTIELLLVTILILAVAFFGYLGYGLIDPEVPVENTAYEYAATQVAAGARVVGTQPNEATSDWLVDELKKLR